MDLVASFQMRNHHAIRFTMPDELELLRIDIESMFVLSATGRLECVNDPGRTIAPRMFFAGCARGNLVHVRADIDGDAAAQLLAIAAGEPPSRDPWALPQCIGKLLDVLSRTPPAMGSASRVPLTVAPHLIWQLPNHLKYEHPATIVRGDSAEGAKLIARFQKDGMPQPMLDAGFMSVADLWEPWCLAMEGEEVAASAIAARLSARAAEIGVYTFPKFRARGYAAAVTAAWASRGAHSSTAPRARIDRRRRAPGSAHDRRKLRPLVTP